MDRLFGENNRTRRCLFGAAALIRNMVIRKGLNCAIESTNDTALNPSRRSFGATAFAAAIGGFALSQGPA
jgi:hypothetical protein